VWEFGPLIFFLPFFHGNSVVPVFLTTLFEEKHTYVPSVLFSILEQGTILIFGGLAGHQIDIRRRKPLVAVLLVGIVLSIDLCLAFMWTLFWFQGDRLVFSQSSILIQVAPRYPPQRSPLPHGISSSLPSIFVAVLLPYLSRHLVLLSKKTGLLGLRYHGATPFGLRWFARMVVLSGGDERSLSTMNAWLRGIDMMAFIAAPFVVSVLNVAFSVCAQHSFCFFLSHVFSDSDNSNHRCWLEFALFCSRACPAVLHIQVSRRLFSNDLTC